MPAAGARRLPAAHADFSHSDEMFQDGHTCDNALTISGGNDRTTFFLSAGATAQRGIITGNNDKFDRILGSLQRIPPGLRQSEGRSEYRLRGRQRRVHHQPQQHRRPAAGRLAHRHPTSTTSRISTRSPGCTAPTASPTPRPARSRRPGCYDNPFFVANESFNNSEVSRTFGGINAEFTATSLASLHYTLGADYSNDERTQAWPWSTSNTTVVGVNGVGGVNAGYIKSFQIDHNLTATARYKVSPRFSGSVTVGQNLNSNDYQTRQTLGTGLIAPQPFNLGNTAAQLPPYDYQQTIRLESYFAQVSADLWDQLFLTAAIRNDGASTFGADSRRNWYPKGSAAWTFFRSAEGTERFLTYGKLRAAYGQSGTQPAPYLLNSVLLGAWNGTTAAGDRRSRPGQNGAGGLITSYILPTDDLGPGAGQGVRDRIRPRALWQDKADIGFTWYRAVSSDVILNLPVAGSTGYTQKPANAADHQQRGGGGGAEPPAHHHPRLCLGCRASVLPPTGTG